MCTINEGTYLGDFAVVDIPVVDEVVPAYHGEHVKEIDQVHLVVAHDLGIHHIVDDLQTTSIQYIYILVMWVNMTQHTI